MTKTQTQPKENKHILLRPKSKSAAFLNVEKILKMQIRDYFGKDLFWYAVSFSIALAFFGTQRQQAEVLWPLIYSCLTPEQDLAKDRWLPKAFFAPESAPNECLWLPTIEGRGHLRFSYAQWYYFQGTVIGMLVFLSMCAVQWVLYHFKIPFFEQFKIQKDKPWPWEANPEAWKVTFRKSLVSYFINNIFVHLFGMVLVMYLQDWKIQWQFEPQQLPSNQTIFFQVLFCICIEDTLFYHVHKLLHVKHKYLPLYQWFHKQHHEYKVPVGISAQYAHPVEHFFANFSAFLVGPIILGSRMHFWTVLTWGIVRMKDTTEGHSGYDFPWSIFRLIPFGTGPAYHDFHHSANVGNYSSFTSIWDTFWDTNTEFWEEYFPLGPRRQESKVSSKME